MKSGDKILFAFPLLLVVSVTAAAGALFFSTRDFEETYIENETRDVMTQAQSVAEVVRLDVVGGNLASAAAYCEAYPKPTRVSLIRADGIVIADSDGKERLLDNHLHREEVAAALKGDAFTNTRFSATENAQMIYCAVPVVIDGNVEFVVRLAIFNRDVDEVVSAAKRNTILAGALGVIFAVGIGCYIFVSVRRPFERLQRSAARVCRGELNVRIFIPEKGLVRDLALTVSRMKEQLKNQLDRITAERNSREILFAALSEAIVLFDENGEALYFNSAARNVFGIDESAAKFDLARCRSPELMRLANLAFRENKPIEAEITREVSKTTRVLFVKGGIVIHDGKRRLLLAIADLTNLRRLESFRSDFIANVSHEIKTPLTGILGAVDALEAGALDNPEAREKFIKILQSQAKRLNNLVRDVLSLAAIERRQTEGDEKDKTVFRVDAVVENAVSICLPRAEEKKIELKITENVPVEICGDPALIEQALTNLISNAIKYSESPTVEISSEKLGNALVLSVRDYGIGIAPEHCDRLFERFYCVNQAHSRALGGTGLGLSIVKHIARLHGGNAYVKSTPGKGSTFRISIPL